MYLGKTLFAQVMDFLPWKTFHRIVDRYGGDHRTRSLSCAEQFRVMAFAQLTYRESLRDIEVCLAAQAGKLYHMGIGAAVARSTLADANESRDWRIYFELAQRLITKARALYVDEDFGVELANTVYALDATTIDLCLSMFPWAPFRSTKAAVKLHTLLDLRGSIPTFIHISDGKMHDVNVLDLLLIEAGAFYIMDRGYLDFERLYALDQAGGFFVTRAKRNLDARRVYSAPVDRDTGLICDQTIALNGFYAAKHYPGHLRRIRYRDPETGKNLVFLTNQFALPAGLSGIQRTPNRACREPPRPTACYLTHRQYARIESGQEHSLRALHRDLVIDAKSFVFDATGPPRPCRHVEEISPPVLERLAPHVTGQGESGARRFHISFRRSSGVSRTPSPFGSPGLPVTMLILPSGSISTRATSTPAARTAATARTISSFRNALRPRGTRGPSAGNASCAPTLGARRSLK